MKRNIVTILLSASLLFSSAACGEASNESISSNVQEVTQDNSHADALEDGNSEPLDDIESEDNLDAVDSDESVDELTPEEEAQKEKERQESLTVYADMIDEIQTDIPEITVQYVVSTDSGGKDMSIHMPLLESEDATIRKMAQLTTTKETLMNNNGITDITIFVMNGEECSGMVLFSNEGGSFEPVVNTL